MKKIISNAKKVISNAFRTASCRLDIARAVVAYMVAEARLKKLHPVRDARMRELVGMQCRARRLACELAMKKLSTI